MRFRSSFIAFLFFVCCTVRAFAAQSYSAIYVFGDSYCDTGNIALATKGAKPLSPPYYQGRFSNGPIWVEHLAGTFKLSVLPSLAGGTDYATGGADLLQSVVTSTGTIPSVEAQVAEYLAAHGGKADPGALYVLEGGGNDILNATSGSPTQLGFSIAVGLAELEVALRQAGATHFLIPNLIDVSLLPAGRAHAAFAASAVLSANQTLATLLSIEDYLEGIQIYTVDAYSLLHSIADDPTHFGFANILTPCLSAAGEVCADPDHTLFWDTEHPTVFGHSLLAVLAGSVVHP